MRHTNLFNTFLSLFVLLSFLITPIASFAQSNVNKSTLNDFVWTTVQLGEENFEIHINSLGSSISPGQVLSESTDQVDINQIYITQNGELIETQQAQELIVLAQSILKLKNLPDSQKTASYYLSNWYVRSEHRNPWSNPEYDVYVPDSPPEWWVNQFIYEGSFEAGIDYFDQRSEIYAQIILDAALQPDFYDEINDDVELNLELDALLETVEMNSKGYQIASFILDGKNNFILDDAYLDEMAEMDPELKERLEVAEVCNVIDNILTIIEVPLQYRRDGLRLLFLQSLANQRAERRLDAISYFISTNQASIDDALIEGYEIARNRFLQMRTAHYDQLDDAILSIVENDPLETVINAVDVTLAIKKIWDILILKSGSAAIGKVLLPYQLSWETYKKLRGQELNAQRAAIAATFQRTLFNENTTQTLPELFNDAVSVNAINGDLAQKAVDLQDVNTYLGWQCLLYNEEIIGNFYTNIWGNIIDFFYFGGNPYNDYRNDLEIDLETAKIRHKFAMEPFYETYEYGEYNWLFKETEQVLLETNTPPTIKFSNPSTSGEIISGSYFIRAEVISANTINRVEFLIQNQNGIDIHSCTDTTAPYECYWWTEVPPIDNGRYNIQVIAYDSEGQEGIGGSWIILNNNTSDSGYWPSITLINPDDYTAYEYFNIKWKDEDLDSNALISLYYETEKSDCSGGVEIVKFIQENWTSDQYYWHFADDLESGDYWVYGIIDDEVHPVGCSYISNPIHVSPPTIQDSFSIDHILVEEVEGDGDGVLDTGESFALSIYLHNFSSLSRNEVKVKLSTEQGNVDITDDSVKYGTILGGNTVRSAAEFNFSTRPNISLDIPFSVGILYRDEEGHQYIDNETISIHLEENDTTPPLITWGPTIDSISPDSAIISWGTNEPSNSVVNYGQTTSYGMVEQDKSFSTEHTMSVRGLTPNTHYYYQIQSLDPSGNGPISAIGDFTSSNLGSGLHVLQVDYPNPDSIFGIAYDSSDGNLWILHRNSSLFSKISKYNPSTHSIMSTIDINFLSELNNSVRGLAFDGNYLWFADKSDEIIYRITTSGTVAGQYSWPGNEPSGIAWDGNNIWVADQTNLEICQTDTNIQPIYCFASPGTNPMDLTWDGLNLWNVDATSHLLYKISPSGERLATYPLYGYLARGVSYYPGGIWINLDVNPTEMLAKLSFEEDQTSPIIEGLPSANSETGTAAIIEWITDEPSNSIVKYGFSTCNQMAPISNIYTTNHLINLIELSPNQTYHYCVGSQDLPGNEITWSQEYTFTTAGLTGLNIVNSIYAVDNGESGITFDASNMWVIEDNYISKVDQNSGRHLDTIVMAVGDDPRGLAWDGSAFWYAEDDSEPNELIYRINPSNGAVISSILSPQSDTEGIAWDNGFLWVVDGSHKMVYKVNSSSGSIVSSFATTWSDMRSIAYDGTNLWIFDGETDQIYKVSTSGSILGSYPFPENSIHGLTWYQGYLWVLDDHWRYQLTNTPTYAPVIAKVQANSKSGGTFSAGSIITIQVYEQYGRDGYTGDITISSATDDPGIINQPLVDMNNGIYTYEWNTAGQTSASDYKVEVRLTDGVYEDSDGLSSNPDITLVLAPTLSAIETYTINNPGALRGATWAGSNFWVTEDYLYPDKLYRIDLSTGNILSTCTSEDDGYLTRPKGITWDGSQLWVVNYINTPNITRHNTNCSISARFTFPGIYPEAIAWDGSNLWISDGDLHRIYQMNTSGSVLGYIPLPYEASEGLVWNGTNLWSNDSWWGGLQRLNLTTGNVEQYYALNVNAHNIAWDGTNFYGVIDDHIITKLGVKPDLALAELVADQINVPEGQPINITATTFAHDLTVSNTELRFFLGHPDSSGTLINSAISLGTITPGTPVIQILSWSSLAPGEYEICARVDALNTIDESNETNNTSCIDVTVYDTDIEPPDVSNIVINEILGDGDGIIEENEKIEATWVVEDESGIASSIFTLDNNSYIGSLITENQYSVEIPALAAGLYEFSIITTDGDNTPQIDTEIGEIKIEYADAEVSNVWPLPGQTNVSERIDVITNFSTEMVIQEGTTVTNSITISDSNGDVFLGVINYSSENQAASFYTYQNLYPGMTYQVKVPQSENITDEQGNKLNTATTWSFTIAPDSDAPILDVSLPVEGSLVQGVVDILGTISDRTSITVVVDYGVGENPTSWVKIYSDQDLYLVDDVITQWDTSDLANGLYTIRVTVIDEFNNISQQSRFITINNIILSPTIAYIYPTSGKLGQTLLVDIYGSNFAHDVDVYFDTTLAENITWLSSSHLQITVPINLPEGSYDITVSNDEDKFFILEDAFSLIRGENIYLPIIIFKNQSLTLLNSPGNLVAQYAATTQINLTWVDNSSDETDFHIERSPNGSTSWIEITTVVENVETHSDTGLTCGTPYYYRVRAHRSSDNQYSSYSNIAGATTQACTTPSAFNKTSPINGAIDQSLNAQLSWQATSPITKYQYCYDTSDDNSCTNWTDVSATSTNVTLSGLDFGTIYYWHVRAYNGTNGPTYSNGSATSFWSFSTINASPEIDVRGNGISILNQDTTPTIDDNTDFGNVGISIGGITHTFTIQNFGNGNLLLGGSPIVNIEGANASDFTVSTQPNSPITPGNSTSFIVNFNPSTEGERWATIHIENNDEDENPYNFYIKGTGTTMPEIDVRGIGISIPDQDTTPRVDDNTDFGSIGVSNEFITHTFTIYNTGGANLSLDGSSIVAVEGTNASDFSVTTLPTSPILPGNSTSFDVTFNPSAEGERWAAIKISNNDSNEDPYNFYIKGIGISSNTDFNFQDFSSTSMLNLVGDASVVSNTLRLNPASQEVRGGIWYSEKQPVSNGFSTTFQFQITDQVNGGADGLAFIIQNNSATVLGGGIGFNNLANSLAVEFDTYGVSESSDPNDNHVSVQTNGTGANSSDHYYSLGSSILIPNLSDGSVHTAQIEYTAETLNVYVDDLSTPVLTVNINLTSILSLDNGTAWVGLTGGTGASYENHDIFSWLYTSP